MSNRVNRFATTISAIFFCAFTSPASAASDARIEAAKLCTQYIPFNERQYGIPSHLLSAISSTESGRWHDGLKIVLPYPWTVNAEGKGYYFESKAEAIAAVKKMRAEGKRSIDIGCMQVNLVHHANAFSSIEEAFDPKSNITYAASFLRNLYESEGSWRKAAAAYHSKTPERGSAYVGRVFRAWETIIGRLRLSPDDTMKKADAGYDGRDIMPNAPAKKTVKDSSPRAEKSTTTASREKTGYKPIQMKVINVSNQPKNHNDGIMIIKPDVTEQQVASSSQTPITLARADTETLQAAPTPNAKIVRISGSATPVKYTNLSAPSASQNTTADSGPRFIFSD
jgi:hypothetical protein